MALKQNIHCIIINFFILLLSATPLRAVTFSDALEYCKNEDNIFIYDDIGTSQDKCIDNYMVLPWKDWLIILITLGLMGIFILIPMSLFYLIRSLR